MFDLKHLKIIELLEPVRTIKKNESLLYKTLAFGDLST
jgi:hypothetical protein